MKKRFLPHFHLDPTRLHTGLSNLWVVGLGVAFAGTLAVALGAASLFVGVFDADVAVPDATADVESISRDDLSRSVIIVGARVRDFERLKTVPPVLPDPSI